MGKRGLTKKEKGFVKDYVKTGNGVKSILNNYDTTDYKTAGVMASENLDKPRIQEAILSIAEQIPDSLLVEKHLELLNKTDENGIDTQAVKSGLDMAYKLKGIYAPEKSLTLNIDIKATEQVKEVALKAIEALKQKEDEQI